MSQETEILSDTPKFFKLQKRVLASYYKRECVICFEVLANKNITLFKCGHLCCFSCAIRLEQNENFSCPLCRKELRSPRNHYAIEENDEDIEYVEETFEVRGGYDIASNDIIPTIDGETQFTNFHSAVMHFQRLKATNYYRVLFVVSDLQQNVEPSQLGDGLYWVNPSETLNSLYCVKGIIQTYTINDEIVVDFLVTNNLSEAETYYGMFQRQNDYQSLCIVERKPEPLSYTNPKFLHYWSRIKYIGICVDCEEMNPPNFLFVDDEICLECLGICCKCGDIVPHSVLCEHFVCFRCIDERQLCVDCLA